MYEGTLYDMNILNVLTLDFFVFSPVRRYNGKMKIFYEKKRNNYQFHIEMYYLHTYVQ